MRGRVAAQIKPKSKDARKKVAMCKKIVQRERFEKAIESEEEKRESEVVDIDSIIVPDTYTGTCHPKTSSLAGARRLR